ncbi:MAG: cytochrome c3 family protein [Candidatus Sulfobium sp.]|jgi:c(7)-type cytochrome triheme protein
MVRGKIFFAALVTTGLLLGMNAAARADFYDLPPLPPPEQYGNVLMDRTSTAYGMKAVVFSHWFHRTNYTCRVCHLELEFGFRTGSSEITEKANREGRFCGACHNGKTAFGHTKENCERCHSGGDFYGADKFEGLLSSLPGAEFGNKINWVAALADGLIKPKDSLMDDYQPMEFEKTLKLAAEGWSSIRPAVFSHKAHGRWLDCANCHPDIFNIKKKTTKHFSMARMEKKEFCGACHLTVAFPLDDCKRCHKR